MMLSILYCVRDQHDSSLILLAAIVCLLTTAGTVRLCRQVRWAGERAKNIWLVMAGMMAGLGIWATHFIAMLGYDPGFVIGYHFDLTIASMAVVILAATLSLVVAARHDSMSRALWAAVLMGGGVAGMHYLGMAALEMPAIIRWNLTYVAASAILAVIPMAGAIPLALRGNSMKSAVAAAALMSAGVVALHFTGMTAMTLIPSRSDFSPGTLMSPRAMSLWVFLAVSCAIALTATAAMISRRTAIAMRRHERESRLRVEKMKEQLDLALENMHQGLCLYDSDGHLLLWNQRFLDMYRLSAGDIRPGMTVGEVGRIGIAKHVPAEELDDRVVKMEQALQSTLAGETDMPLISEYPDLIVCVRSRPLADGGWVSTFDDITEQRTTEARIHHLALHDGLTGLPNRRRFNEIVDRGLDIAAHSGAHFGLVVIDLDNFKDINDSQGHSAGDEALKMVANELRQIVADEEHAARLGGDEFAATILYREDHELADFVSRIAGCLGKSCAEDNYGFIVNGSIGVATYPADGEDRDQLCNNADLAMYRAKAAIGEHICYYEKGMDETARNRRQLAADLRGAAARNELTILYQPQRSLKDGLLNGYEALLRWDHPHRGSVSPADFIPVAEETGDILAIGEWVLREACQEAVLWTKDETIAVNLSAVQLTQTGLPELVAQILLETGLPPRRLELEITETAIIADKARALHILRKLKGMGISIAIDDFGTGYSSLDTLNSFPFDKIKIDKSFVIGSEDRPQARAIIRAVLALGRSLGVPVLAEGVETAVHASLLLAEGCDQVQGYHFGRPQSAPSLIASGQPMMPARTAN
ncbi:MAG: EAL domain-containing protein [Sphingobium sp.]